MIVALIGVVIIVGLLFLGRTLSGSLDGSGNAVDDAVVGAVEGGEIVAPVDLGNGQKGCPAGSIASTKSQGKCVKK